MVIDFAPCFITLIILMCFFFFMAYVYHMRGRAADRAIEDAYTDYQQALNHLKYAPGSADAKEAALAAGRAYAALARESEGVTFPDEIALANDISATTAGANIAATATAGTHEQRLKRLDDLKAKGLLTDVEYTNQRAKILAEL